MFATGNGYEQIADCSSRRAQTSMLPYDMIALHLIHYIFSIFEIILLVIFPNRYIYIHFFVPYIFSKSHIIDRKSVV